MPRIFISYRHSDEKFAGRFAQSVQEYVGRRRVYIDGENIRGGRFWPKIEKAIRSCEFFIPVIGEGWKQDPRLFDDKEDFVRREIELALAQKSDEKIILVLPRGAKPPERLPASIQALDGLDAEFVGEEVDKFREDVESIVRAYKLQPWSWRVVKSRTLRYIIGAAGILLLLVILLLAIEIFAFNRKKPPTMTESAAFVSEHRATIPAGRGFTEIRKG